MFRLQRDSRQLKKCGLFLAAALLATLTGAPAFALGGGTKERLKAGGYVILMRYGQMRPNHAPNPDVNCLPQRDPPETNVIDVARTGERFKKFGIKITKVLSSHSCPALETAQLLAPSVTVEPRDELEGSLTRKDRSVRCQTVRKLRKEIAAWKGPGNLLVVSHRSPLKEISGRSLLPGGYIVVDPRTLKIIAEDN